METVAITPNVITQNLTMVWNHEELKQYLIQVTDKYKGLIVTDANLDDMKKTLKEVVSMRTKLTSFGTDRKRELKTPADTFAMELKDVLSVISGVEGPLKDQINGYEQAEMMKRQNSVMREIELKANGLGVRAEFLETFIPNPKLWENKTAKLSDVTVAIDEQLKELKAQQDLHDDNEQIKKEKVEFLKCELAKLNESYALSTPIQENEIGWMYNLSIVDAKEKMKALFEQRLEIEKAVAEKVEVKKAVRETPVDAHVFIQKESVKGEDYTACNIETITIKVAGTKTALDTLIEFMGDAGIYFEVIL